MAGKLYKYNDSWVSYGYLHDTFGYTDAPSFDISYKSTNPWGEMDTTGYMSSTDFYDIRTYEFWKQGLVGWYSLDEMAVQGSYPDTAIETMMRNGNVTSNAAYITDPNGVDYYIIEAAISDGWLTLDEWALLGWEPGSAVESPLCGSMGADYSESMMGYPAERMERGGIEFTGLLSENVIPESGAVEVDSDGSIDILLGSQWNGSTWAGGEVQYQNSKIARLGVMNQNDADAVVAYGLTLTGEVTAYHSGPFGFIKYNSNYEFEIMGVYSDVSGETQIDTDLSWFAVNSNNNWVNLGGAGWGPPYLVSGIKTVRLKIKAPSAPVQYDIWIETVDLANNVVVALRSVFTGLTATRANTIVNNAPTYLSRYNSYLNNQGGPYTQADAIAMRDQLQSKIPSGDTSTFGIRPVST